MENNVGVVLLVQVLLIFLNAVFASAEIAVLSVNEIKLEQWVQEGNNRACRLQKLIADPARFLSTIQIAITLSGFLGSAFAAEGFSGRLVAWVQSLGVTWPVHTLNTLAVIFITLVLAFFSLVFGELVPKRVAMKKANQLAMAVSGPVAFISVLFKPVVGLLSFSTNVVLRFLGIDPRQEEEQVSEEEIRMMVEAGGEKGTIDKEEQEFIQNVFEFDDITAEEIATHRTDVVVLWMEDGDDVWLRTIRDSRHSLFPVCDDSADKVVGVLNTKDYFRLDDQSRQNVLQKAVTPAYFVPETIKLDVLFRNMKKNKNYLAVLLDEYGGMQGIVTLNDLLEELVGNIDEKDQDVPEQVMAVEQIDGETWKIVGNVALSEIEEVTGLPLVSEQFDTFTGLLFDTLGMVPPDGQKQLTVALPGCSVQIEKIREHQVVLATLKKN